MLTLSSESTLRSHLYRLVPVLIPGFPATHRSIFCVPPRGPILTFFRQMSALESILWPASIAESGSTTHFVVLGPNARATSKHHLPKPLSHPRCERGAVARASSSSACQRLPLHQPVTDMPELHISSFQMIVTTVNPVAVMPTWTVADHLCACVAFQ